MHAQRQSWWLVALLSGVAGALLVLLLPLVPVKALGLPPYWLHLCIGVGIVVTLFVLTRNPAWRYLRAYSTLISCLVVANALPEFKLTVSSGGWVGHWIQEGVPGHLNIVLGGLAVVLMVLDYLTHRPLAPRREQDEQFRRNLELKKNAEKRLKLETDLRALELFRAGVDSNSSTSEAAGALFALIELDHLGFALRLLRQLWPQDRIDASGAMWVLNRALNAESPADQEEAAELLRAYAEKLPDDRGGHVWLQPPESWKPQLSLSARDSLLQALLRCFLSRELGYWEEQYLVGTALLLAHVLESDSSPLVQAGAILALEQLLQTHRHSGDITHGSRTVNLASLRRQVAERAAWARTQASPLHHDLAAQLQRWRTRERKNVPGVSSPQLNC